MNPHRQKWLEQNGPCVDCGTWDNLEVDHVDPQQKVTHRFWNWSKEEREQEAAKCAPRCTTCHKKKTAIDMGYKGLVHGTRTGYTYYACRCNECREAATIGMRKYHEGTSP